MSMPANYMENIHVDMFTRDFENGYHYLVRRLDVALKFHRWHFTNTSSEQRQRDS
jgi:hypothetical protein